MFQNNFFEIFKAKILRCKGDSDSIWCMSRLTIYFPVYLPVLCLVMSRLFAYRFASLATRMEQYVAGQSRDLVDQAYTKFVSGSFSKLFCFVISHPIFGWLSPNS